MFDDEVTDGGWLVEHDGSAAGLNLPAAGSSSGFATSFIGLPPDEDSAVEPVVASIRAFCAVWAAEMS